ncbi:spore germination protein [Caloramator fervidus]|uniref:Spore germination protein n=1 Tax=Caloramator fervidus TaxID=29344 RepID=A0A1H5RMJ4_9CLOT|nr:endospore germination permease [Caloramator fervidus]SEF38721.1 spore germination protein [Caloramator fervidus]
MVPNDDKISQFQVALIVFLTPIGVGIFTLPSTLAKDVETNGWLSLILGGLVCLLEIYFICCIAKKYSPAKFTDVLKQLFGKFLGTIFAVIIFIYFLIFSALEVRLFAETTKMYLLYKTPLEYIIIPFLFLGIILARCGIEPIARFFEAVIYLVAITFILVFLLYLPKSDYSNLLPVLRIHPLKLLKGVEDSFFSFSGFEVLLLLFPFMRDSKKSFKVSAISIMLITFIYVVIFVQCIARFGVDYTKTLLYPTLSLIKSSDVPGAFIEGIEGLLFSLWIVLIFTTLAMFIFAYSVIAGDLLKQKEAKHIVILFLPAVYIVSLLPDNIASTFELVDKLIKSLGYFVILILPTLMFIVSKIKGERA